MGMYTEVVVKVNLITDLPEDVFAVLNCMFGEGKIIPSKLPEHKFFTLPRWCNIGKCSSYYHHPEPVNSLYVNYGTTYIFSRSDIKNYNEEIEEFFDWLKPYVDVSEGQCIGYMWYEEQLEPTLIYK